MANPTHAGVAKIQTKYLLTKCKEEIATDFLSAEVQNDIKNLKDTEKSDKFKLKGRNKRRPQNRIDPKSKICSRVLSGKQCIYGDKCKFSHDTKAFLAQKPKDIGDKCVLFSLYGRCKYGIACRFGGSHISDGVSVVASNSSDSEKSESLNVCNVLSPELRHQLWKRKYDFVKSKSILEEVEFKKRKWNDSVGHDSADVSRNTINKLPSEKDLSETSNSEEMINPDNGTTIESEPFVEESKHSLRDIGGINSDPKSFDVEINSSEPVSTVEGDKLDSNSSGTVPEILAVDSELGSSKDRTDVIIGGQDVLHGKSSASDTVGERTNVHSEGAGSSDIRPVGCVLDDLNVSHRPTKKLIDFRNKLYLAPLTTVGNLPFRRICKEFGADITCGEMAMCTNLLQGQQSEWALVKRHRTEDIFGVQLCGGYVDSMTRCAELLNDNLSMDFIDINCGCPIDLVYEKGEGCGLMGKANKLERIVASMSSVLDVPLTVKMRTGIYGHKNLADGLVSRLSRAGAAMVTIHGRSREQRYTKSADWSYINSCCGRAAPMPVFGNGDVLSYEEYTRRLTDTSVAGAMIARGALIKPWIFREIKEARDWDISAAERLDVVRKYVDYGLEHWGSDDQGVETTRRFLLEWLSFAYRYIPAGILEQAPQRINEKPPMYRGRDDAETLLASSYCGDWIKISEMFLGPVPVGFHFLPKHKANAYK